MTKHDNAAIAFIQERDVLVSTAMKAIENVVRRLKKLGLTEQAALIHAAKMFEIELKPSDFEQKPSPPTELRQAA